MLNPYRMNLQNLGEFGSKYVLFRGNQNNDHDNVLIGGNFHKNKALFIKNVSAVA